MINRCGSEAQEGHIRVSVGGFRLERSCFN